MNNLEYYKTDPEGRWIEYKGDIVGTPDRGISFSLIFRVKKNSFYAEVIDERMNHLKKHEVLSVIGCIPNNSAKFMVGEDEYNKLQEIYKENKKNEKNIKSSRESS